MDDNLFDRLGDSKNEQQKQQNAIDDATRKQQERMLEYFKSVLEQNSTLSVQVPSVVVNGGGKTRYDFIQDQLAPILDKRIHTVGSLIQACDQVYYNMASFGIFDRISVGLEDQPASIFTSSNILNVRPIVNLQQSKRFLAKTGTDLGNSEGNGYVNMTMKSIFGGAEMISFDATMGTRTRPSYFLNFNSPIQNSSKWRGEIIGYHTARTIPYASYDQIIRGLTTKIRCTNHELGFETSWRTIAATEDYVSKSIREQAGDGIKGSIYHSWSFDKRDSSLLPTCGYYFKTVQEVAGLLGELPYIKNTFESQAAVSTVDKFITANLGLRGGLLWAAENKKTHLMDRFYLGGPNDVRGFSLGGIGPMDGKDSIGGDAFVAAGLSVFSKLPKLDMNNPLRAQFFINGGSNLPLNQQNVSNTIHQLVTKPSVAMGLGLAYIHSVARFELNFTLPLVARTNENTRKGLQFGVGFSFL